MEMYFHWASQTLLRNSRYTQPYGTCPCSKVCVLPFCTGCNSAPPTHTHTHKQLDNPTNTNTYEAPSARGFTYRAAARWDKGVQNTSGARAAGVSSMLHASSNCCVAAPPAEPRAHAHDTKGGDHRENISLPARRQSQKHCNLTRERALGEGTPEPSLVAHTQYRHRNKGGRWGAHCNINPVL
jgi:hypothetical protein